MLLTLDLKKPTVIRSHACQAKITTATIDDIVIIMCNIFYCISYINTPFNVKKLLKIRSCCVTIPLSLLKLSFFFRFPRRRNLHEIILAKKKQVKSKAKRCLLGQQWTATEREKEIFHLKLSSHLHLSTLYTA